MTRGFDGSRAGRRWLAGVAVGLVLLSGAYILLAEPEFGRDLIRALLGLSGGVTAGGV